MFVRFLFLRGKQRHWERGFTYHLCIIQYGVKVFNPECIHRSVHHNPVPKNGRLLSVNVTSVFCRGRCFNWRRNNLSAFQKSIREISLTWCNVVLMISSVFQSKSKVNITANENKAKYHEPMRSRSKHVHSLEAR